LQFTANPVVSSVALQLATSNINAGTAGKVLLAVNAMDADGQIIVGNGSYIDVNGNPVALTLDITNYQNGGKGTAVIQGPSYITAPGQSATYLRYDGNWLDHATVSVTSNSSAVTSLSGTTLTTTPHAIEYTSSALSGSGLHGLALGPDGNLWAAGYSNSSIDRVTPSGSITKFTSGITSSSSPNAIIAGPDGNLWFTEQTSSKIGKISTSGTVTEYSTGLSGSAPIGIVSGPDGKVWFTECGNGCYGGTGGSYVGNISSTGQISDFAVNGSSARGILVTPDKNIWVTYSFSHYLSQIAYNQIETDYSYADSYSGNYPDTILVGNDGNLWTMDEDGRYIYRFTPGTNTITPFTSGITTNANISKLVNGPDGNIWFTERTTGYIGRITTSGTVTEYDSANGLSSTGSTIGITLGPDGNLWFVDTNNNAVGKFVL